MKRKTRIQLAVLLSALLIGGTIYNVFMPKKMKIAVKTADGSIKKLIGTKHNKANDTLFIRQITFPDTAWHICHDEQQETTYTTSVRLLNAQEASATITVKKAVVTITEAN